MIKSLLILALICVTSSVTAVADDGWKDLFDGKSFKGWHQINGKAKYVVKDGTIIGTSVPKEPNSFMRSDKTYGDFILEFDAWVDTPLNSGVQFRSLTDKTYRNGRVHGYQMELDTSPRSWTAGVYDEARNGWLYSLTRNKKARKAYKADTWNHYRIEAIGDNLKTWINGVPAANVIVDFTAEGFIGLQVHSVGKDDEKIGKQVRWKNIRIKTTDLVAETKYMGDAIDQYNFLPNTLTKRQVAEGWKLLWDGKTSKGWIGAKTKVFPTKGWVMKDGVLSVISSGGAESRNGGDIITEEEFTNFELEVDFRITEGANSGIKYFVDPDLLKGDGSAIGLEFQILDDKRHPDAKMGTSGNRTMGSLYDLITAVNSSEPGRLGKRVNAIGTWNRARLVVKGSKVEHWLNNSKVIEFDRHSQMFRSLVQTSKYAKWANFGEWKKGPILLQDHGDKVDFRTIKIRELK